MAMPILFSTTLLVSAFLLFCIEPMVAKMLLPLLGGVPAVWNTCLVFFQGALLLGYVFALGTLRLLGPRRQALLQIVVVGGPLLALPIVIDERLADRFAGLGPVGQVLAVLTIAAGFPFFALSTIAPTLQRWYSTTGARRAADPYFLYAASNVGSLGALLLYPLVVEPRFGLGQQAAMLRVGYVALALLVIGCALTTVRLAQAQAQAQAKAPPVRGRQRLRWIFLSAIPSAYLVAITAHLTTDVTPTPFLWVAPLAIYLLSFVLVFSTRPLIAHTRVSRVLPLFATATAYVLAISTTDPVYIVLPVHVIAFFGACMLCHGELARERPEPGRLNEFYVWMSIGGLIGGVSVALVTPLISTRAIELPACIVLTLLVRPTFEKEAGGDLAQRRRRDRIVPVVVLIGTSALGLIARGLPLSLHGIVIVLPFAPLLLVYRFLARPRLFAACIGAVLLGSAFFPEPFGDVLFRERNFFGSLTVTHDASGRWTQINHGTTIHGIQSIDPGGKREPRSYYARKGPVGDVLAAYAEAPELSRRVGAIGLGAGTLAAYAKAGEDWTFFEINPAVVRIAREPSYFTYLSDAFPGDVGLRIVVGDARLEIAKERARYGLLVIDAFSSDAIPVHLVTAEAMALYTSKMADGGLMAWHISNRYINLRPVIAALAASQGWTARIREDLDTVARSDEGRTPSVWVAMSADAAILGRLGAAWKPLVPRPRFQVWTDQKSSIVPLLNF